MANSRDAGEVRLDLKLLKGRPLSEQVYEQLKAAIIQGLLVADTRLTETDVAQQIGVSPTPVREAFRRLAAEGFLDIIPWKGATIRSVTEKDLQETYQCREVLEGLACRLATERIDAKGVQRLRRLIAESHKAPGAGSVVKLNSDIHDIIMDYAANSKLKAMLGFFHEIILRDRALTAYNEGRRQEIDAEHEAIVMAKEKKRSRQSRSIDAATCSQRVCLSQKKSRL